MQLPLTNIINVSVSEAQAGVGQYNTSNLAIFTQEVFADSFGTLGYNIYLDPTQVGVDFGTDSETFKMANAIFSQQPNILAGGGYLVVIPFVEAKQTLAFSGIAASGTFTIQFSEGTTAAINWNDIASAIQTKVRAVPGLEAVKVSGSIASQSLVLDLLGLYGPQTLVVIGSNSLATSVPAAVTVTPTTTQVGESMAAAITRTKDLVQYFGILATEIFDEATTLAAAAVVQALNKIIFFVSRDDTDVQAGGILDLLRTGNFSQSRGLFYGADNDSDCLVMEASYAGRALSTDFSGSNTTATMHLKDLVGVQPDPSMTQALLALCQTAGADVYASFQGVPKVFTSGANSFFDQVYNLRWFVGALQVAGFNYLAESSTKIPQTENGIDGLKGAYRAICEAAVTNQYSAPGTWNSATTFGNQADFIANIAQRGYYIYSAPISKQLQADRVLRKAPLIQIALKEAGAVQSSNVIVYVNA